MNPSLLSKFGTLLQSNDIFRNILNMLKFKTGKQMLLQKKAALDKIYYLNKIQMTSSGTL